jgi:hypothetical protein
MDLVVDKGVKGINNLAEVLLIEFYVNIHMIPCFDLAFFFFFLLDGSDRTIIPLNLFFCVIFQVTYQPSNVGMHLVYSYNY